MSNEAPFYQDVAEGPEQVVATWAVAADGVRLRLAVWPTGTKGTVLLFPGRTEYVEKYGRTAGELAALGYATISIDWRGQGLADRLIADRRVGHIGQFNDYQLDVAVMLEHAQAQGLPEPYFLVAHSMGGCIGLRSLHEELPVSAAVFSAPMWGLGMASHIRPFAWALSWSSRYVGQSHRFAPGTSDQTYVIEAPYDDNMLTSDADMFAYMNRQVTTHSDLALAGPSLQWVNEALRETRTLRNMTPPPVRALTFLGTNERIVDTRPIHDVMGRWSNGQLQMVTGGEHEVLMETPQIRSDVLAQTVAHFTAQA